ncbi:hypothetical protein Bca4012_087793 [Brassica carinata]|uniref:40S ribosomal protein S12 n=1 Tax=Brassica carinata TaxID=52824 RepID=A0A8X7PFU2_BRACI|nr:hypothetical protein Bca52824_088502 [Brassica carinata]
MVITTIIDSTREERRERWRRCGLLRPNLINIGEISFERLQFIPLMLLVSQGSCFEPELRSMELTLRKARAHGGVVRGLHESAKLIEKRVAQLCVLAEDCNQPDYVKLVKALCADHNINLLTVPSAKTLGEWAGLCKIDSEGNARKVVGCSKFSRRI